MLDQREEMPKTCCRAAHSFLRRLDIDTASPDDKRGSQKRGQVLACSNIQAVQMAQPKSKPAEDDN